MKSVSGLVSPIVLISVYCLLNIRWDKIYLDYVPCHWESIHLMVWDHQWYRYQRGVVGQP